MQVVRAPLVDVAWRQLSGAGPKYGCIVTVHVDELADSSVNLFCRPWVKTEDCWTAHWDITRQVKERFDVEGISIPFPQRDVHTHAVPATT